MPQGSTIECHGVRFACAEGGAEVLGGIDLVVPAGTSLALVGPSGGGKSLMGLLARFHDPVAGGVRLGGVDLRDLDPVLLMTRVAYVQQDHLFAGTILDNIRTTRPVATDDEVLEAARRARVADFVPDLAAGWDTVVPSGGGNLSGGQRQRISIARPCSRGPTSSWTRPPHSSTRRASAPSARPSLSFDDGRRSSVAHRLRSIVDYDQSPAATRGRCWPSAGRRRSPDERRCVRGGVRESQAVPGQRHGGAARPSVANERARSRSQPRLPVGLSESPTNDSSVVTASAPRVSHCCAT